MDWPVIVALVLGTLVMLFPVALIWYSIGGGIYCYLHDKRISKLVCNIDADCPPGYKCSGGKCVLSIN